MSLSGPNRKRRGCAGPALAEDAAELICFSRSPDLLLAPKEKCCQEGFFSLEKIFADKLIYKIVTLYVNIMPLRASSEPFAVAI